MKGRSANIEVMLEAVLRGAAKILGCSSANLVVFNRETREVRIRVGTMAEREEKLYDIESILGKTFHETHLKIDGNVETSMVYASWRDRKIYETSSLSKLVGNAFPLEFVRQASVMIGEYRFLCVPAMSGQRLFGVIIFTKDNAYPFGPQQREILLRYAQRIAEIMENELRGRGTVNMAGPVDFDHSFPDLHFFIDTEGLVTGSSSPSAIISDEVSTDPEVDNAGRINDPSDIPVEIMQEIKVTARGMLDGDKKEFESMHFDFPSDGCVDSFENAPYIKTDLSRIRMRSENLVMCTLYELRSKSRSPVQNQLLHFALGDTAPAILLDPDYRITSCNKATANLCGYETEELLGSPISMLFTDEQDIRTILNHQFLFLANGYFEDVAAVRHKSGRVFPGKVEALLLADEKNQVIGSLVVIRDQSSLADETGGREASSQMMKQERLATMGEMAAQLAHEIRNPLVSIGATLEVLTSEVDGEGDTADTLRMLSSEINRMDMILKDYLSLAARRNTTAATVNPAEILEDTRRFLNGMKKREGVSIKSSVDPDLSVLADHDGLRHVFFNLLLNAMEVSPEGGRIKCHSSVSNSEIAVHIDDDGPGLTSSPSDCFKPFFTTKQNGTGLGLTVCHKIVAAHGGTVSLKNIPEGGCRATVVLPRKLNQ